MIYLILSIPVSFGFSQLFKYSQTKECKPIPLSVFNYLFLSLLLLAYHLIKGFPIIEQGMVSLGVISGLIYITALTFLMAAFKYSSVNLSLLSFRLSLVIPVIIAVLFWGESLSINKSLGILLSMAAIFFMSSGVRYQHEISTFKVILLIGGVFIFQGLAQVVTQAIVYYNYSHAQLFILMVIGASASLFGTSIIFIRKIKFTKKEFYYGSFIGTYNTVCLALILKALNHVSPALYWPVSGCSIVILDILSARFFWGEKITPKIIIGGFFAIIAIFIILS